MGPEHDNSLPAVTRAFEFVRHNLELGVWRSGECLPSTRVLALQAEVSVRTMIKAVSILKKQGFLHGVERGKLRAGNGETPPADHFPELKHSWQIKRSRLEKDIISGHFAHNGVLPSSKILQARYGACSATMRKILQSLSHDGFISLKGKTWELPRSSVHQRHERILFVPCLYQERPFSALSNGQYTIVDRFEEECLARGLSVGLARIDFFDLFQTRRALASAAMTERVLGYIFDVSFETPELRTTYGEFLRAAQKLERPVAVIDEFGGFVLPAEVASNPAIQVFRIAGKSAGERMALTLLGLGHTSVVYLSPYHDMRWSRERLAGIEEQYAQAGYGNRVFTITGNQLLNIDVALMEQMAAAGFDETLIRRAFGVDRTESQVDHVYNRFLQSGTGHPSVSADRRDRIDMRINLQSLADFIRSNPDEDFFDRMCGGALWAASNRLYAGRLEALFERALAFDQATAWICATDGIAVHAVQYLQAKGRSVPAEISVVGFDNKPLEGPGKRPTSFDFNAKVFVHRTLDFILRPPRPRGAYRHAPIEIEGVVMERETSGRVRDHSGNSGK